MLDQRAFIDRIEAADVDELAQLMARPSPEEEAALRAYFGDERYRSLRRLAVRQRTRRGEAEGKEGNVVVLHGIMGGELSTGSSRLWLRVPRILLGGLSALRLASDGRRDADADAKVTATGVLKDYYGELLLYLSASWNVKAFPFDWRKDMKETAAQLDAQVGKWFGDEGPFHIVGHSMGGLLARAFALHHGGRWRSMWDAASDGRRGGRLIMLGTPNHGSYGAPQALTGLAETVQKLALVDITHSREELLAIFNTFPGLYQLLPSALADPAADPLYRARTYGGFPISQLHLDGARAFHQGLREVIDPQRLIYVAGHSQPTLDAVDTSRVGDGRAYRFTTAGDGTVSHRLGLLDGVTTYYVDCEHAALSSNRFVMPVVDSLLRVGRTSLLPTAPPAPRALDDADQARLRARFEGERDAQLRQVERLALRLETRSGGGAEPPAVSSEELELRQLLAGGLLGRGPRKRAAPGPAPRVERGPAPPPIRLHVEFGRIEAVGATNGVATVDAVAVGHYQGVRPMAAELALSRAIEAPAAGAAPGDGGLDLVTELTDRGTYQGKLGQCFFLPFPRAAAAAAAADGAAAGSDRLLALCGLGEPGRLGIPELTVAVRELIWSLARLGRRHLASVLIGGGPGNLAIRDAISGWLAALASVQRGDGAGPRRLTDLTLVEADLDKLRTEIVPALDDEVRRFNQRGEQPLFVFTPPPAAEQAAWQQRAAATAHPAAEARARAPEDIPPTVISVSYERGRYRFGAITDRASIPERELIISELLVASANQELADEADPELQLERGQLLHGLLIPEDLRSRFSSTGPLILLVDRASARVHWEMMARPDDGSWALDRGSRPRPQEAFFGTARGLTRRLRTQVAPVPEPPPPPARTLRVLVVADPCAEARLPGAEREGMEVVALFERFNGAHGPTSRQRVEVVSLIGPHEATPTNVLRELMVRQYDVLHFAGHCAYDDQAPQESGWIFSAGQRLTALELDRVDRVPLFVFSNACESGVTTIGPRVRDAAGLAPSFAEAFFQQGVANFVCTAWPIDDASAREFALRLYATLLGLDLDVVRAGDLLGEAAEPPPAGAAPPARPFGAMTDALREARLRVFELPGGERTWGAYQHYGNPHYRFFQPQPAEQVVRHARPRKAAAAPAS